MGRSAMNGAIVHEWISATGGSEKVLDVMVDTFPDAAVWCLWNDVPEERYAGRQVHESWLASTPLRRSKPIALPLMLATWRRLQGSKDTEWILTSSHLFAHHARFKRSDAKKLAYVYTPARYVWTPELDERGSGVLPRAASPALKRIDKRRAGEAASMAAISNFVRERISQTWERDARVIYPPVDVLNMQEVDWNDRLSETEHDLLDQLPSSFVLGASRLVSYKRIDLALKCGEAASLPVVIAGSGPELARLRALAEDLKISVTFIPRPSDALLYSLYMRAQVFAFFAIEDFGIMPVEANALGVPVIGQRQGGVSETVTDGVSGALVEDPSSASEIRRAVDRCASVSSSDCRQHARKFDTSVFVREIRAWVDAEGRS